MRIRHYGILSNRHRHDHLALCRRLLGDASSAPAEAIEAAKRLEGAVSVTPTRVCPSCGAGRMILLAEFPPLPIAIKFEEANMRVVVDSS